MRPIPNLRGLRARLSITLVALVAVTAIVLGVGAYAFVDYSLHERLRADAVRQADFNLSVLIPSRFQSGAGRDAFRDSGLLEALRLRGDDLGGAIVDFDFGAGDDALVTSAPLLGVIPAIPQRVRSIVASGQIGYAWVDAADGPRLIVGGRLPPAGPDVYFVTDAAPLETALGQLRLGLVVVGLVLVAIALATARRVARGILGPVTAGSRAAERIAGGDLAARVEVTSRDELGAWASSFNRMAAALEETIDRLEAAQAQNRQFVADVSHELRTPVTALVGEASLLRDHVADLPPDARRASELLVADVGRLRVLVDDLMELSRFDAAAESRRTEPVDLAALVRAVVASRHADATVDVPAWPVRVETEPRRLDRILGNLLDNAREHAPGAPVEVSLDVDGSVAVLRVADRGPGVPPDQLDRIFDRFHKVDPSRRAGSSGLGLAIAAEHAALLGGELAARPRPGGGLVFELRLPVTGPLPVGDAPVTPRLDAPDLTQPAPRSTS